VAVRLTKFEKKENCMAVNGSTPLKPEAMVEQLRALRLQIPEYSQITIADARSLRTAAAADRSFVNASINAIGASPGVESAIGITPEALRLEADDAVRWSAVEDELRAMLQGVIAANLTRRHRLGSTALQAYGITRMLVRKPEHADLLPHLAEMKRLNRFGRGKAKTPDEVPAKKPETDPAKKPNPA
jgi:hypothetical protein